MAIFRITGAIFLGLVLIVDGSNGATCSGSDLTALNDLINRYGQQLSNAAAAGDPLKAMLASEVQEIQIGSRPIIGRDDVIANFKYEFSKYPVASYTSRNTASGCNAYTAWVSGTANAVIANQQLTFAWEFAFKRCIWKCDYRITHIIRNQL